MWNEVEFPDPWHFTNVIPTIEQRSEMIEKIVQYPNRGGDLVFSNSFKHSSNPRISNYESSRASSSSIPIRTTRVEKASTLANPHNIKLKGVMSHTNLVKPFYTEENDFTQGSQQNESLDMSSTYSEMINTISEKFEINKNLLRQEFYLEANEEKIVWFFSKVPKNLRILYQEEFYTYLRNEQKNFTCWIWFELFKQKEYPKYTGRRINNTSTKTKIWKTSDDIVIESIHPSEAKIDKNINGTIIRASLFKTKPEDKGTASIVDVKRIMEQNNYTNMFLKSLGDQLNRIEEIIETQDHIKTSFVKKDNKPLFKPFEFSKKFQENPYVNQELI